MRKALSLFISVAFFVSTPLAMAITTGALVSDEARANVYPDGVYWDSLIDADQTDEAAESTVDDVYLPTVNMVTEVLYIGSNTIFDEIMFDISTAGESSRICVFTTCYHYDLEYYNGSTSSWETLSYTDTTNNFETEGIGSWTFDIPEAWYDDDSKNTVYGQTLFWVRITPDEDATITTPADAAEIALHAYNFELTVSDELGNPMEDFEEGDFVIEGGTSNDMDGIRNLGDGVYQLALDAGLTDSNYDVSVHQTGYVNEVASTGVLASIQKSEDIEVQFTHVISITDQEGDGLTPDEVSVGSTECTISGSRAYCPLSASDDNSDADVRVEKSGYYTVESALSASRETKYDVQVETEVELTVDPTACVSGFEDIYGHWAEDYIEDLYCRGVVNGKDEDTFEPSGNATRAEFLKMSLLNAGYDVEGATGAEFSDVSTGDWFYEYVAFGAEEGFIEGYEDGTFRPNDPINRAEAVVITMRIAGIAEYEVDEDWDEFDDVSSEDWFAYAVEVAADEGIVEGYDDGDFRPGNEITRAELAAIVVRAYEAYYE